MVTIHGCTSYRTIITKTAMVGIFPEILRPPKKCLKQIFLALLDKLYSAALALRLDQLSACPKILHS